MADAKIKVTKMDAARRQLGTAIELWFTDGDPIAIHTLAAATHEIMHTLFKRKGLQGLVFDSDLIKEEYRGEFAKRMKEDANFFKHAREDADAKREFDPRVNEFLILASVVALQRMGEAFNATELAFYWWLWIHRPNFFILKDPNYHLPVNLRRDLRDIEKKQFFEMSQLLWRQRLGA